MDDKRYESDEPFSDCFVDSEIYGNGIAVAVERCPLCLRSRRPFFCTECVNAGKFSRNSSDLERYCDLRHKLDVITAERLEWVERIRQKVASKEANAAKADEIRNLKTKIRLLKWSIKETAEKKAIAEKYHSKQHRSNRQNAEKLQRYHDSIPKMRSTYDLSLDKAKVKGEELSERVGALKDVRARVVSDLTADIFPVVELTAEGNISYSLGLEGSSLLLSTARQLSEACQLAYMSGQWVHTDRYGNTLIKIVESTLPGNGDYSAGVTSDRQELASFAEDRQRFASTNKRWEIVSGLCYTTQLMQLLSGLLHVTLPRKIPYSMFGFKDFSERQLNQAVGQLNHDMLHLCFSQGVQKDRMIARHTMHNLLLLLRSDQLGQDQAWGDEVSMVEAVNDGCVSEEDSEEEEVEPPTDWDFVAKGELPEVGPGSLASAHHSHTASWAYNPASYAGHMLSGTQSTASGLVTSAAASVASLWSRATGGPAGDR